MNDDPIAAKLASVEEAARVDAANYQSTSARQLQMRRQAARHEAGHAILIAVAKLRLGGTCICPPPHDQPELDWGGDTTWDPPRVRSLGDELVAAFAGEAVEQPDRTEVPGPESTDGEAAITILNEHNVPLDQRAATMAAAWLRARKLVRDHTDQIEAVTEQLLESDRIARDDLRALVSELLGVVVAAADDPEFRGCCTE